MKTTDKINVSQFIEREFSAIPIHFLERGYTFGEDLYEITPAVFHEGDQVFSKWSGEEGEIIEIKGETALIRVDSQSWEEEWELSEIAKDRDHYGYPMWSTLWMADTLMENFILEHMYQVAEIGFKIYETEEGDILLGIDGAGYDFYENHWNPLYNLIYA